MAIFKGSGVAIVTPFKEDGSIDYDKLDELIDYHCENKTDSIIICGTTGESATMTEEEHMDCVKFAIERTKKRIPVVAGTGSNCTRTAIDIPYLTAYENIVLPVRLDGKTEDKKLLEEIIDFLELDGKLSNYPNHLSGGQQQRVAIARALISKPAIILADEPTGNLDSRTSEKVIDLLKMTSEKFHKTIVMITHNPEIAEKADMRIRIEDGKITHKERLK